MTVLGPPWLSGGAGSAVGPAWLWLAAGVLGGLAGVVLARWLRPAPYRVEDEVGRPLRPVGWVAPVTALLWLSLAWRFGGGGLVAYLPVVLYLATVGVALAAVDVDVHRLPERLTLPSYPVVAVLLLLASAVTGEWRALLAALLAGVANLLLHFLLYLLAVFVSPGGLGFGDVVLAGILGLVLGWLGFDSVVVSVLAAFLVAGAAAAALLLTRRATRQSSIAFGPFMLVGAWVALMVSPARLLLTA